MDQFRIKHQSDKLKLIREVNVMKVLKEAEFLFQNGWNLSCYHTTLYLVVKILNSEELSRTQLAERFSTLSKKHIFYVNERCQFRYLINLSEALIERLDHRVLDLVYTFN